MKCLIIAAGLGSRLNSRTKSKPLLPLLGMPLIERVMRAALDGGVSEFVVVTGFDGPRVRHSIDEFATGQGIQVTHVINEAWKKPNGLSVLAARQSLNEPFVLTMSDHLFDPRIVSNVAAQSPPSGGVVLAADYDIKNPLVNLDDVTRVFSTDGFIDQIGKHIQSYNAFDTGVFMCTPALFEAIDQSAKLGDASLTGGMRILASARKAITLDIGNLFWMDIDEPEDAEKAESLLRTMAAA